MRMLFSELPLVTEETLKQGGNNHPLDHGSKRLADGCDLTHARQSTDCRNACFRGTIEV